jgi:hypothetical protein
LWILKTDADCGNRDEEMQEDHRRWLALIGRPSYRPFVSAT